jgi:hypothetical protein
MGRVDSEHLIAAALSAYTTDGWPGTPFRSAGAFDVRPLPLAGF